MRTLSRRRFLKRTLGGLGASVSLPYLEAFAGTSAPPLRFCPIMVPNGILKKFWTPEEGPLGTLPPTLAPLEPWKDRLCVVGGLGNHCAGLPADGPGDHARGAATFLTCRRAKKSETEIEVGQSIDQVIAERTGQLTRYRSIEICADKMAFPDSGYSMILSTTIAYADARTPLSNEGDPQRLFQQLFKGVDEENSKKEFKIRRQNRKSILDYVLGEGNDLRRRLGRADQARMEEYLTSVREVEKRLDRQAELSLAGQSCPVSGIVVPSAADFPKRLKLFADLLVLAFRCDLTRVASFMMAAEGSNRAYPFLGIEAAHHSISHHGTNAKKIEQLGLIDRFHVQQLAYLVEKLGEVKEEGQSLLDRTILLYGSGINDGDQHDHDDLPILVLGAGSALLKSGHCLKRNKAEPLANLHLRIAQAMGTPIKAFADSTRALTA